MNHRQPLFTNGSDSTTRARSTGISFGGRGTYLANWTPSSGQFWSDVIPLGQILWPGLPKDPAIGATPRLFGATPRL